MKRLQPGNADSFQNVYEYDHQRNVHDTADEVLVFFGYVRGPFRGR